jgi:hypothetical protein
MEIKPQPEVKRKNVVAVESQQEAIILHNAWLSRRRYLGSTLLAIVGDKVLKDLQSAVVTEDYPYEFTMSDRQIGKLERGLFGKPLPFDAALASTYVDAQVRVRDHIEADLLRQENEVEQHLSELEERRGDT